jgi:hypothetical protein
MSDMFRLVANHAGMECASHSVHWISKAAHLQVMKGINLFVAVQGCPACGGSGANNASISHTMAVIKTAQCMD